MKAIYFILCFACFSVLPLRAQKNLTPNKPLTTYFLAGTNIQDSSSLMFFGTNNHKNKPRTLKLNLEEISQENKFQIIVCPDSTALYKSYYDTIPGFKLFVINRSDSTLTIPAEDYRIYMTRQVFYKNKWHNIGSIGHSFCGNSYHNVLITTGKYWEFEAPKIKGEIKSLMRFKLNIKHDKLVYSNTFKGSFNRKQLTTSL